MKSQGAEAKHLNGCSSRLNNSEGTVANQIAAGSTKLSPNLIAVSVLDSLLTLLKFENELKKMPKKKEGAM